MRNFFEFQFNYKAVKLYAISHKINYWEKRSSPWPLVVNNLEKRWNIFLGIQLTRHWTCKSPMGGDITLMQQMSW